MAQLDTATLAQRVVTLGLVSSSQLQDCRNPKGQLPPDPAEFIRLLERKGFLTNFQSKKLLKGEQDGFFMGRYRLLYKISSGSFGRVFRADEPATGEIVAVKVLRKRWNENSKNVDMFEREAKVGMTMRHPNIVSIISMTRDIPTKQYYIVMEFVEGSTLRDLLKMRGKLPAADALRLIEDAAAGLSYSFSRGITHRDIKLTNLLISTNGVAKLVDFGLAGLDTSAGFEEEGAQVDRSVDYAGLEKATGVPAGDVRSDIFFLGCVLYEMLTGRPPLDMTKDKNLRMQKQRFTNVKPIQPGETDGGPRVLRLVESMMSLNPQNRYQTPAQLLEAIRDVRRDMSGKAEAAAPSEPKLFIVEKDSRLRELLRDKFKDLGYRVFSAANPTLAMDRYRQEPFDALIIDAGTTGQEGFDVFDRITNMADSNKTPCAAILMLGDNQDPWAEKVKDRPLVAVMTRPITFKQLYAQLREMLKQR